MRGRDSSLIPKERGPQANACASAWWQQQWRGERFPHLCRGGVRVVCWVIGILIFCFIFKCFILIKYSLYRSSLLFCTSMDKDDNFVSFINFLIQKHSFLFHGEGNGYPLQYSSLENAMDCIVHGVSKSQT